jgi:hypothetical protein
VWLRVDAPTNAAFHASLADRRRPFPSHSQIRKLPLGQSRQRIFSARETAPHPNFGVRTTRRGRDIFAKTFLFQRVTGFRGCAFPLLLDTPHKSAIRKQFLTHEGRVPDAILIVGWGRCLRAASQAAPGRLRASCPPVLRPVRGVHPLDWDRRKAGNAAAGRVPGNLARSRKAEA